MQLDLAGHWRFALDSSRVGLEHKWFNCPLPDTIALPGTTDQARKSPRNPRTNHTSHLTRLHPYLGPAWYQRDLDIPDAWQNKRITLFLERTRHTTVWIDDQTFGECDSLAAPHIYDLTSALAPGKHRLTIRIDNTHPIPGGGHHTAEDTQTNWNGILGRIHLAATDLVHLADLQIFTHPQSTPPSLTARITLGNLTPLPASGSITLSVQNSPLNQLRNRVPCFYGVGAPEKHVEGGAIDSNSQTPQKQFPPLTTSFTNLRNGSVIEIPYPLTPDAKLWDEFAPHLYQLTATLHATLPHSLSGSGHWTLDTGHSLTVPFGLRSFTARGTQFAINNRTTFLRGKHDACVFPLTGYAPMTVEEWLRVLAIAQSYGINHYRFHTWCPPEAAFTAADILGFYFQPELANFGGDFSKELPRYHYAFSECRRIFQAFGNHPSFVMFALGNENGGGRHVRAEIVQHLRSLDNRRLYTQSSNYEHTGPHLAPGDDYWVTFRTRPTGADYAVRGSFGHCDMPLGHIQNGPANTAFTFSHALADIPLPVVGHEIGQYQVYPNFNEIPKYTGVLYPYNFEVFKQRLADKGMLNQADDFFKASGQLAVLCYREDIEAALRTPGFAGFQLLDLQDFPGQGTALVGILDAFMDSKGLITPDAWRQFCSPTVPLACFDSYTWTSDQTFFADLQLAHFGPAPITAATLDWSLCAADSKTIISGSLPLENLPPGGLYPLQKLEIPLKSIDKPQKLELQLALAGTSHRNAYPLWVYPPAATIQKSIKANEKLIVRTLAEALPRLASGQAVVLLPELAGLQNSVEGLFASDFWCYPMFRQICQDLRRPIAPGTLGLLIQERHPIFAQFPTEFHSHWQWFNIAMRARPLILDATPHEFRPVVQVIDNFERNHKLGLILEAKVGAGRLLICASDLLGLQDTDPAARQLLSSILTYAGSAHFTPAATWTPEMLRQLLP